MTTALQTTAVVIQLPAFSKEIAISSEWLTKRNDALATAQSVTQVTCQKDYDNAGEALRLVTKLDTGIEKMRKELTAPFLSAQKTIKAKVDEACLPLQEEKDRLKKLSGDWYMAEQRRIAAENAERELRDREAAEQALAEEAFAREQAEALGLDAPPPVVIVEVATPVESAPVSDNAKVQMRIDVEVVEDSAVPRSFCMVDMRLVNAYKRDNKDELEKRIANGEGDSIVPGLKFTLRPDVMGR